MSLVARRMRTVRQVPAWQQAWATAYAAAQNGNGQAHIACYGDSVTQGYYATAPYFTNGWVGQMAAGIATATGVTPGTGWIPTKDEFQLTDSRTSNAGTWDSSTGAGFFSVFRFGNASGDTFTLGPIDCSSFKVMYMRAASGGSFTVKVDGTLAGTYSCNGSNAVLTATISAGSHGSHTMLIEWSASGNIFPIAVEAISQPNNGVKVSTIAEGSTQCSALVGTSSLIASRYCVQAVNDVDLGIVSFGLNEAFFGTTTATFKTHMTTLIGDLQTIGASVLILVAPPPNPTHISAVTWTSFRTAMAELSVSLGTGILNMTDYWTSYAVSGGTYYHDNVHPNNAGHANMGSVVSSYVLDAAT